MRHRTAWHALVLRGRWWLRRLDRETPDWMQWLTPWGTSLVLHVALLLLFAFALFVKPDAGAESTNLDGRFMGADQLTDDITSLSPDDRAGDPFTTLDSIEPPSFALLPDPVVISAMELPPEHQIAPLIELNPRPRDSLLPSLDGPPRPIAALGSLQLMAPFSGRSSETRAKLVRREGGTVESERAVERGLDWIVRHQRPDGGWSLDCSGQCKAPRCPQRPSMTSEVAGTGLALLPLLGAGHTHKEPGRYQQSIQKGLDFLRKLQDPDGAFPFDDSGNTGMYAHAIATMAVCEALGLTNDPELKKTARNAIGFIISAQSAENGGWRYRPGQSGDTSVLGWQWFALRSAYLAGIEIPPPTVVAAQAYLNQAAADQMGATYSYMPGGKPTPVMTAEALLVRQYFGWPRKHPAMIEGAKMVVADLLASRDRNVYYWYYATQMLHNMGGPAWNAWNQRVREALISLQSRSRGCDRGSWDSMLPSPDRWGTVAGRLYTTSLSLLTLEVYYRYLPLYREGDTRPFDAAPNDEPDRKKPAPASPDDDESPPIARS